MQALTQEDRFACITLLVIIAVAAALSVSTWQDAPGTAQLLRLLALLVLGVFALRRHNWARIVLGVLFSLAATLSLGSLLLLETTQSQPPLRLAAMAVCYTASAAVLFTRSSVLSYFQAHRKTSSTLQKPEV